jgi:hypothetical protein
MTGDWEGDGSDTMGLLGSTEARFYLKFDHDSGPADVDFLFGDQGWIPIAGDF